MLRREKNIAWCGWWAAQHDLVWPALEAADELLTPEDAEDRGDRPRCCARATSRASQWDGAGRDRQKRARRWSSRNGKRCPSPRRTARSVPPASSRATPTGTSGWPSRSRRRATRTWKRSRSRAPTASSSRSSCPARPSECAPLARQMIDRTHALGTRSGEAQFRKNLLMARFHVDDALDETLVAARHLMAQPLNPRQRDHVEAHLVLACADLGLDEEIPAILANAYGFTAHDLTSRVDDPLGQGGGRLAGRAAPPRRYETATECRSLPVGGLPVARDGGAGPAARGARPRPRPGAPLSGVLFPNLVGANKESRAIVAMYEHPEASENCGRFLAAVRSWDRISRRNSARCALGGRRSRAPRRRHRARDHDPAHGRAGAARGRAASDAAARRRHACARSASACCAHHAEAIPPLTAAQVEVLDLVGRGLDTRAISRRLVVSEATVETHVRQAMQRLGVPTRLAAAMELVRRRADRQAGRAGATSASRWATTRPTSPKSAIPLEPAPGRAVDAAVRDGREPGSCRPTTTSPARSSPRRAAPRS